MTTFAFLAHLSLGSNSSSLNQSIKASKFCTTTRGKILPNERRLNTFRCAEIYGPTSSNPLHETILKSSSNKETSSLPSYSIIETPHLQDYLDSSQLQTYSSPLLRARKTFTKKGEVVLSNISFDQDDIKLSTDKTFTAFRKAGPREQVYFGTGLRAAIVSCGGLCPGINTVIQELTKSLIKYGASKIFGVPHGYRGFYSDKWRELTLDDAEELHKRGGSILGSSRGGFDLVKIVDAIETRNIDHVYVIGGDGTIMGCKKIYDEIRRRSLKTAVVSVPKTIDNDIAIIDRSFGFETAVDEAQRAISAAYVEAHSFPDCVSVVKLMGRNSGFIACHAALASNEVDCCLVPEEEFVLRGRGGVLEYVEKKINEKGNCVVVVAEGAGHDMYGSVDIGRYILDEVKSYFKEKGREISSKYLDPTYQIRAIPCTTHDNILCILMAHAAVHGAYAGFTGFSCGPVNGANVLLPLNSLAGLQKQLDTSGSMWLRLRMSTEQPDWTIPKDVKRTIDKA